MWNDRSGRWWLDRFQGFIRFICILSVKSVSVMQIYCKMRHYQKIVSSCPFCIIQEFYACGWHTWKLFCVLRTETITCFYVTQEKHAKLMKRNAEQVIMKRRRKVFSRSSCHQKFNISLITFQKMALGFTVGARLSNQLGINVTDTTRNTGFQIQNKQNKTR